MNRRALLAGAASLGVSQTLHAAPAGTAPEPPAGTIQILTYHRIEQRENPPGTIVSPATFAAQMQTLADRAIPVRRLAEVQAQSQSGTITGHSVALTADDGWRSVFTEMFPILQRHRLPITLFINPPMIGTGHAFLTWDMVAELRASGLVDIQAHTLSHPNFNTERHRRTPQDFAAFLHHEIADCRTLLQDRLQEEVQSLAWPFGIHDAQLEEAASQAGYTAAYALGSKPITNHAPKFALPRSQIYETDNPTRFTWIAQGNTRTHPTPTM